MLVLCRKLSERIMIGDDIVVTVVAIGRGTVKLGIDAPRAMDVDREEVYLERKRVREARLNRNNEASPAATDAVSR